MPITLITGPANAGKAQMLLDAVRTQLARGGDPLLVVPTRADGEQYLRELAGEDAVFGVRVERFDGLIAEAVRRAEVSGPPLAGVAREQALAQLAARHMHAPPSAGYVRALGELIAELQVARVSPERFAAALAAWEAADGADASAGGLAGVFAAYHALLERAALLDREQRVATALDRLRTEPWRWRGTPVLFYGFDDFTPIQLDAIDTLGRVVEAPVTVSLTYEAGRTAFAGRAATFAALAPLAHEHHALHPQDGYYAAESRTALAHLERSLFEPLGERLDPAGAVRLLEGADARSELELVAEEISALIERGVEPDEVAVVERASPAGLELLEEVFRRFEVPFVLARRRPFGDSAVGRALLGLLRSAGEDGAAVDLLAWLRAPGQLERPELADRLELALRRAGAESAARARERWEERHWPLEVLDWLREAQQRGPAALAERAARELGRLFAAPRRGAARVLEDRERDEAGALAAGLAALAELRELARFAPELAPADARSLAQALERVSFVSGEPARPGAVTVLDPLALRARRVRALFVCGMQEGVFPAPARRRPVLAEEERRRLAEVSGLRLASHEDALAAERYLLYALAARPEQQLVLSWHAVGEDGAPSSRSLFVDDICDLFDERLVERRSRGEAHGRPGRRTAAGAGRAPARVTALRAEPVLAEMRERTWSASSLERWIGCPVAWFVERLLAAQTLDPDGEPLARGAVAHDALKDVYEALERELGSARITSASLPRALELLASALERGEAGRPLSVAAERRPAIRRRLRADLDRYLRQAAESETPLEPREFELAFGFEPGDERAGGSSLPAAELGEGLRLRGRIDRVDVGERGDAVVYDYKGRTVPPAARWLSDGAVQVALYMRAAEQLLGVRAVGGLYQPLAGSDLRARGLLEEGTVELDCLASDVLPADEFQELLQGAVEAARAAAREAGRGELEGRPATCTYQGRCAYPAICRCER
jgi:ATP-dependent helicase/nuclease subunit B